MKLVVFGATGTVGQQVVRRALEQGHQVTAFARSPDALQMEHPNLTRCAGDVLSQDAVASALIDHEAVLITLGAGRKGSVRSAGTRNIIRAMRESGVRRLVCMSTLGAGDSRPLLNFFWKRIMFGLVLRDAYRDHEEQERFVTESNLDWTVVRPAAFTNGPETGTYEHGQLGVGTRLKAKISRADVASFMLRQLSDLTYLHATPALSY